MHALLQMVVSGLGCGHEWLKDASPEPRRIVCTKCGLYAYVPQPRWQPIKHVSIERATCTERTAANAQA